MVTVIVLVSSQSLIFPKLIHFTLYSFRQLFDKSSELRQLFDKMDKLEQLFDKVDKLEQIS